MTKRASRPRPSREAVNRELRSYVVRVYRRTQSGLAGHIEDVQSGLVRSFRTAGELWSAIGGRNESDRPVE